MESRDTPMHIGALLTFKLPQKGSKTFLQELANHYRSHKKPATPWNLRLTKPHGISIIPKLESVKSLDMDYHFRHHALPSPGGERELGILVSRLHSHPLDKHRPLWELHLIEALEDKRFAIYVKLHPSLLQSSDVYHIMTGALSTDNALQQPPFWAVELESYNSSKKPTFESPAAELAEQLNNASESLAATTRFAGKMFKSAINGHGFKAPRLAPRSSVNASVNSQRRFATQQYDMARIEKLASAADCSINAILAYLCGSAMRRFFKEYNALPEQPMRAAGALQLNEYGESNDRKVTAKIGISLATHIADPLKRLEAIKRSIVRTGNYLSSLPEQARSPYAMLTSLPLIAGQIKGIGRIVPNMYNIGISNNDISSSTLYLNGAKLEAMYPMAHLMQYSALSFDCATYNGTLNIGLTGARDTLPRLQRMALYMDQSLAELESLLLQQEAQA
jgi:WS/DGAT/MGAT family acyltransferase